MNSPLDPKDGYERTQDIVHAAVKSTISAIPIVGGPVGELFSYVFTPPWEGRRDAWIKNIEDDLRKLHTKVEGLNIEKFRENELFVSVVSQATRAALLTHEKEKLRALRAACLNAALHNSQNNDVQHIFISLLDSMTASHIKMLMFLDDQTSFLKDVVFDDNYLHIETYIREAFPEMSERFSMIVVKQLIEKGLAEVEFDTRFPQSYDHTTELGKELLRFIKSPIEEDHEGTQKG